MALKIIGTFSAVMYRLENVGDELPGHQHDFAHPSIILEGEAEAFDDEGKALILKRGDRVEFPAGRWHGIRARSPGVVFINLMPAG